MYSPLENLKLVNMVRHGSAFAMPAATIAASPTGGVISELMLNQIMMK